MQNSKADSTSRNAPTVSSRSPSKDPTNSKAGVNFTGLARRSSNTSVLSRRTDLDSEDSPGKLKNKFTKPRMNRMTELRIAQLQKSQTNAANDEKALAAAKKTRRKESTAVAPSSEVGDVEVPTCAPPPTTTTTATATTLPPVPQSSAPTPPCLPPEVESMRVKLANLQSEFKDKLIGLSGEGFNISCKFVSIVQDGNCQLILQKDDLICFPKTIPAQSVGDLKTLCREALYNGYNIMFEKLIPNIDTSNVSAERSMLQKSMDKELDNLNKELDKFTCNAKTPPNTSVLLQQHKELQIRIDNLVTANSKMETDLVESRKTAAELQNALDEIDKKNKDLAIELADKNIEVVERSVVEDDLRTEIQQLKKINKVLQQRVKEFETQENSRTSKTEDLLKLETQLAQAIADKALLTRKSEELTEIISARDYMLNDMQKQVKELVQFKDMHDLETKQSADHEADQNQIKDLQAKLAVNQSRLESMVQQEQQLREEMEQKKELMSKMKLKVSRLEETVEYHRQVLAVRGERINYLDREMKQREQENARKLNEVMSESSEKNTIITQMTNELASTNEQFQNICATLSIKQTKLHSQEHVIKLLEESNDRSVKLHTKLGEKNALLKDELDHLRRTVKTLMLGSGVNDTEVSDILTE